MKQVQNICLGILVELAFILLVLLAGFFLGWGIFYLYDLKAAAAGF